MWKAEKEREHQIVRTGYRWVSNDGRSNEEYIFNKSPLGIFASVSLL